MRRLLALIAALCLTSSAFAGLNGLSGLSGLSLVGGLDVDVSTYQTNVIAAGSTISSAQLTAVNSFVVGCKTDGVWTKLKDVGTFTGTDLTAALVKLKSLSGTAYTQHNFIAGDYTAATGLTGAATKYLDTGVVPSTMLTIHSTHIGVYDRNLFTTNVTVMGAQNSQSQAINIYHPYSDRKLYSDAYNASTAEVGSAAFLGPVGFVVGTKTASTTHALYWNGASVATGSTNAGTLPTLPIFIFGQNNGSGAASITTHNISLVTIGDGLSSGDVTALTARVQTLQHAILRSPELVLFEGDSITTGNGTATPYPTVVAATLGQPPIYMGNFAVASATINGGSTPTNSLTTRAASVDAEYSTALYRKNILSVAAGHNDFQHSTAAQAFADYKAYCQARRATGYKIIACTLLPTTEAVEPGFNAYRNAFNALLIADTSFYDVLCDFAANSTIGDDADASDTTYYADGKHPTTAAHAIMATISQTAVTAALAL